MVGRLRFLPIGLLFMLVIPACGSNGTVTAIANDTPTDIADSTDNTDSTNTTTPQTPDNSLSSDTNTDHVDTAPEETDRVTDVAIDAANHIHWPVALIKMTRFGLLTTNISVSGEDAKICDSGYLISQPVGYGGRELHFDRCQVGKLTADGALKLGALSELGVSLSTEELSFIWGEHRSTIAGHLILGVDASLGSEQSTVSSYNLVVYQDGLRTLYTQLEAHINMERDSRVYRVQAEFADEDNSYSIDTLLDLAWREGAHPHRGKVRLRHASEFGGYAFDAESGYVGRDVMVQHFTDSGSITVEDSAWESLFPLFSDF